VSDGEGLSISSAASRSRPRRVPNIERAVPRSAACWRCRCMRRAMNCATSWCTQSQYPIAVLMEACRNYPASPMRGASPSICHAQGVNDSIDEAKRWCACSRASGQDQSHSVQSLAGSKYECSDWIRSRILAGGVRRRLCLAGAHAAGRDILAACGQLKSATENSRRASAWRCAPWRWWIEINSCPADRAVPDSKFVKSRSAAHHEGVLRCARDKLGSLHAFIGRSSLSFSPSFSPA